MSFRQLSSRILEPAAMYVMIAGIVALCQPWSMLLHRYGVTIILVGLVGFLIFSHVPREEE
jgi:hypothetical protein